MSINDDTDECNSNRIRDSNGPYIEAVLTGLSVEVTNMGITQDNMEELNERMLAETKYNKLDVVITSGAVSTGKYDFVREAL